MKNFQGEISSQSLVDILQFYIQNQSCVSIKVNHVALIGEIWINEGRITHAITKSNYGIDAFYEMLSWEDGNFKVNLNRLPNHESINKPWTELILEYYVLIDEGKATKSNFKKRQDSYVDSELDFSSVAPISQPKKEQALIKTSSSSNLKSFKEKFKTIMELDGIIGAAIVDVSLGMPIVKESKNNIDLDAYCAYIVEIVKSHKNFLFQLKIQDKIEDIVINLDSNYHIITFILRQDNLFIYVILNKENSNLGMTRLFLMKLEEELEL